MPNYNETPTRELTDEEKEFVADAEAGHFGVLYGDDGAPYAMGARGTSNLFSADVEEIDDAPSRGSIYRLRP